MIAFTGLYGNTRYLRNVRGVCPRCYAKGIMSIVETSLQIKVFALPIKKIRKESYSICHNCWAKLIPTKEALRRTKRSPESLIWQDEFTIS